VKSNFDFLQTEWLAFYAAAKKAEGYVHGDARAACFYTRRALEITVSWLYQNDAALKLPYLDNLSALIHEPTFKTTVGSVVFNKAVLITRLGNQAVHSHRIVTQFDALTGVKELFHLGFWLARTYARGAKPADGLAFDPELLPKTSSGLPQTQDQLKKIADELAARDTKLSALFADKEALSAQLEQARKEIEAIKKKNAATPDTHDYSEAETRDYFIDLLLKEAGWALTEKRDREYEVSGMPNVPGKGFVDYVLWGDDGRPLAVVEAKRTKKSALIGQQQARLYADCLEKQFGRRPVIFYSNGYEHWLWDDVNYPPRPVQGFYKKDELELMIQRRQTRAKLATATIDEAIVERYYQTRGIRRICEAFEKDHDRKSLIVMATGAGKTRTVIALCDLLMRSNWAKRVLFLADRVALVSQAVNAFKKHLPHSAPVNLVTEKATDGRVFVSTYPTMMGLIEESVDGQSRFGAGHFDLIVIDEAHRSVYQKYGAIFRYFDSLLVGLTATPRDEIDRDTYGLFDLEKGVPTDAYELKDAIADKFLVPAKSVSVPLRFLREGVSYDDLSAEEQEQWDELEWDDEAGAPKEVDPESVNKWLFNEDTVDKVLGQELRGLLRAEVAAMNVNNFVVRPERRLVEKYAQAESWVVLGEAEVGELARKVSGLPNELDPEDEEAKRFDLLLLNLQLAVLNSEPAFARLSKQVIAIAGLLEEKASIPMVKLQLAHIQEIQSEEWWKDVTIHMLEQTRKRLRALVKLIEKQHRKPIYTDFEDEMGAETAVELSEFSTADGFEKFREKARAFLRQHLDQIAIHKLRLNEPLTALDLTDLERVLAESGVAKPEHLQRVKTENQGLGLFVRSLIGLDREAATRALGGFTKGKTLSANQIEFVGLIVEYLTANGVMDAALLYDAPFTDLNPQGPEGVFSAKQVDELVGVLEFVRDRAIA
jgi:type I site-specific restriction endonuclease